MNSMNHEDAFLQAIVADPDDIDARLVYADWLEENGDTARAEFIRIGVEAVRCEAFLDEWARVPGRAADGAIAGAMLAAAQHLRQREKALLIGSPVSWGANAWFGDWLSAQDVDPSANWSWRFRRGFVEIIRCRAADWLGQPCPHCTNGKVMINRHVMINRGRVWQTCADCAGVGRVNAHGPAIVRQQPVLELELIGEFAQEDPTFLETRWGGLPGYFRGQLGLNWARYVAGLPILPLILEKTTPETDD
jgi:uncharacterized protein (TIGR02996 family)